VVDEVFPAVAASSLTPEEIAERLRLFIRTNENLSPLERSELITWVDETAGDDATNVETRNKAMIEKALELGGEELVDQFQRAAEHRREPENTGGEVA
jgi:hypothetical protein